jgi:hypothetical protein
MTEVEQISLAALVHSASLGRPLAGTSLTALVGMFIGARLVWTALAQLGL